MCILMVASMQTTLFPVDVEAQTVPVFEEWVTTSGDFDDDWGKAVVTDSLGNVYVAGYDRSGASANYVTTKYDTAGNELWVARSDGSAGGDGWAEAMVLDESAGQLYVTGVSTGPRPNYDFATIAYDLDGEELWTARYDRAVLDPARSPYSADDRARDLAVGPNGDIYVTGWSYNGANISGGTDFDYVTVAYDQHGSELWVARYNNPMNGFEMPAAITVDAATGNIYVTGHGINNSFSNIDVITVAYDSSGNELWVDLYSGVGNRQDSGNDVATDSAGNVYVTGETKADDSSFNYDILTIAFDPSGRRNWVNSHDGLEHMWDRGRAVEVGPSGRIYVTGFSWNSITKHDLTTIAYDPSGAQAWLSTYNGPADGAERPTAMAVDPVDERIYVAAFSDGVGLYNDDWATVAYDSDGKEVWAMRKAGADSNSSDWPQAIAVDPFGDVVVTGRMNWVAGTNDSDISTIKYSYALCADGIDNDGDELTDYPEDRGCTGPRDESELPRNDVLIDVQPRSNHNRISARPGFPVSVAILGSERIGVRDVDVTTLAFGPGGATPVFDLTNPLVYSLSLRDMNEDDEDDLATMFRSGETMLPLGESQACLTGEIAGELFEACDTVFVSLPGCGRSFEVSLVLLPLIWLRGRPRGTRG
jgi:hypothetical protein